MMCKFTCKNAKDFLIKCEIAGVTDSRIKQRENLEAWFGRSRPLIHPHFIWEVTESGLLSCTPAEWSNSSLLDISNISTIGGL